jgi:flagella basal body P-ring formation protein FlgA
MNFSHWFGFMLCLCLTGSFLDLDAQEAPRLLSPAITNGVAPATVAEKPVPKATLDEAALLRLLTEKLQTDFVRERGELELHFGRPWQPIPVPDEPLSLKILELPNAGVSSQFIARFEMLTAARSLGVWQAVLQAKVWREIYVARVPLVRGRILDPADLVQERRDVLPLRGELGEIAGNDVQQELSENLPAGAPLTARALKIRPVVRRGQTAEALLSDGSMQITMKVEVLEDGIPGQAVRLRNLQSRREFRGIVQNENRILISF